MISSHHRPVVDKLVLSAAVDPYLGMEALAEYSSLSTRTLRGLLADPVRPLPHFKIGSRTVVRRSDFDAWAAHHRRVGSDVEEKIARLRKRKPVAY